MNQPGFVSAFFRSFVDPTVYPSLSRQSVGATLGHYVLVVLLVCAGYAGVTHYTAVSFVEEYLPAIMAEVPEFEVVDGKVVTQVEQPYEITLEGESFFVLDTAHPRQHVEGMDQGIVLGESEIFIKKDTGEIREYPLEGDWSVDQSVVQEWWLYLRPWIFPSVLVLVGLWQLCWKAIQVLVAAAVLSAAVPTKPPFGVCWRMASYAVGPAMVWGLVIYSISLMGITIPGAPLGFYALLIGVPWWASLRLHESEAGRAFH